MLALALAAAPAPDATLGRLRAQLPQGWSMALTEGELTLVRAAKVHALFQNMINAPTSMESEEEVERRVVANGREVECKLVYRVEPRWGPERRQQARDANAALFAQLEALPAKMGVAALRHRLFKGDEVFDPKTEDDKKRVAEYLQERKKLEEGVVALPELDTDRFSLFPKERSGVSDVYTLVAPAKASQEAYQVENRLRELCKRP